VTASGSSVLSWTALGHAALAVVCAAALLVDATPILGVHPAAKPLKFAASIAIFLATVAVLLPLLSVRPASARVAAWILSATMTAEMVVIALQAARGTTSHFNTRTPLDQALWQVMLIAIVVALIAMVWIAMVATFRPLAGGTIDAVLVLAWRAGLWLFLLAAVSGFAMGGRLQHGIGGLDGGPGMAVTNWSLRHGDLRVPHFVALHALQALPVLSMALSRLRAGSTLRYALVIAAVVATAALCATTLVQAFAGRPVVAGAVDRIRSAAP
jgi:hypothetical protein